MPLKQKKHKVTVVNATVHEKRKFYGTAQGPLIVNIFLCDLFYFQEDVAVARCADNTTPYRTSKTNDLVKKEK